jgi:2-succinyl-6-hydroxy-2,4-cyclohexadiene-1-carboxylate synthase
MGARAALLHSTQFPDCWDALILISANPGIENANERCQRRQSDEKLAASIQSQGVPMFLKFWQKTPLIRSQQSIPREWSSTMQSNRLKHEADGLANSLRQFGQGSCPNLWPELTKLKMPICLLSGQLDTKYTQISQRMRSISPNPLSTHAVISDASHMPHLEQNQKTVATIIRFLKKITN